MKKYAGGAILSLRTSIQNFPSKFLAKWQAMVMAVSAKSSVGCFVQRAARENPDAVWEKAFPFEYWRQSVERQAVWGRSIPASDGQLMAPPSWRLADAVDALGEQSHCIPPIVLEKGASGTIGKTI